MQEELTRQKKENEAGNIRYHGGNTPFLYGKVICGCCASPFTRRTFRKSSSKENKETYKVWICREQRKGRDGNGCAMRKVKEDELLAEIAGKMGCDPAAEFPAEQFKQEVEKVYIGEQGIEVVRKIKKRPLNR